MKPITLTILLALISLLNGCGSSSGKGTTKVVDVTKKQSITILALGVDPNYVNGLTIRCYGEIDGKVSISGNSWQPETLSGKVDLKFYHDWFSTTCVIEYDPDKVTKGNLKIDYEFH